METQNEILGRVRLPQSVQASLSCEHLLMKSALTLIVGLLGVVAFYPQANALRCHSCAGSDYIPNAVLKVLVKLNLTAVTQQGSCKSEAEESSCDNGQFCVKNAVTYRIAFNGIKYNWNTFTKGCASPDEVAPTVEIPNEQSSSPKPMQSGVCYTSNNDTGVAVTTVKSLCYCNDKDFCNGSMSLSTSLFSVLLFLVLALHI
ncbi:hypothetical protein QR680_001094 [Steinernema hermaphroditum]|uniref:Uncharacterized protein n=1 Tax=Steinernema hermaphroditum TaxID=289476 RepID=A0AA39GWX5_9BILA|nr:hypothetical protein QR680_001094 [Steinernema hermaphroditum]